MWVTRAEPGATRTFDRLAELGFDPVLAPLLMIRSLPGPAPDLTDVTALAFTSGNGIAAFAALSPSRMLPVFTVGDATAEAARAAGFLSVQSAGGALADLAALLTVSARDRGLVLVPGALEPAGDLPAMLAGQVRAQALPVYEAVETGIAAPRAFDAVLVHSARAARALGAVAHRPGGVAVVMSAAVAAALGEGSGLEIRIAATPDESALLAALGKPAPPV